jgi:repressor LexA
MAKSKINNQVSFSLAPVQREALEYLRRFIADHGYGPTLKDISEFLGVRSASTAHFHLSRLEQKGFIKRGIQGGIELVEQSFSQTILERSPTAVPLLGLIAAGSPIEAIEDPNLTIDIPPQYFSKNRELYCLQVTGDSMIDAHIMDGDIIIVEKKNTADDGQIVVALLEDATATLKTFRRLKGGKVMLVPHNPKHKPITLDSVDIQGRLVGIMREL